MGEALDPADLLAILLGLAVAIGCINHLWIRLPPAIGMLLGSLALSASDHIFHLHIMRWFRGTFAAANLPHFFLDGAVALLVFAGSLHVDIKELSRRRWLILLLATASVILSTAIFGTGMWLAFAAIVGESLFNDGAGVVLFLLALGVTQGDTLVLGHGHVLAALLREIVGGAGLGLVAGWGPRCLCAAFTTKACSC